MEHNQQTQQEIAAAVLLTQVYQDYQKEKKWAKRKSYLYYGLFFFMLLGIFQSFHSGSNTQSPENEQYVAVVKIEGGIGAEDGILAKDFEEFFDKTFANEKIVGVVLEIDSPGGGVYDTCAIFEQIQRLKLQYPDKKVVSYVKSIAASGGYWLSLASDRIYCNRFSTIGSIGVYTQMLNIPDFLEEHKIHSKVFRTGPYKGMGHPLKKLTEDEERYLNESIQEIFAIFKETVVQRRGDRLVQEPLLFTGRTWMGYQALQLGLVDDCSLSLPQMVQKEFGDYHYQYVAPDEDPFAFMGNLKHFMGHRSSLMSQISSQHTILV